MQQQDATNLISFDSSKGYLTVDSDNPLSTNDLNSENFYNLLIKLNINDKLELNDTFLTSKFYLTPDELSSLLEPNDTNSVTNAEKMNNSSLEETTYSNMSSVDLSQNSDLLENSNLKKENDDNCHCLEICCLLKMNALDYFDFDKN